ncbi:ACT domain-containing protein, partial [Rhizobium jaguaris]|uniref:ACT domain-containing protein n=1 Tax=Rhizobium jaguaris TaxID=1312183 RepID=UPI0039BFC6CA
MKSYVLRVSCKSTRGIVAAIANYLADQGCNIVDSSQFDDLDTGKFFMRVSFISEEGVAQDALVEGFKPVAAKFQMDAEIYDAHKRMK